MKGKLVAPVFKCAVACIILLLGLTNAIAQEVIPDFYRDPGLYPNRSYVNQSVNEDIDPFTGALQQHYVDIYLPGNGGFDLKVIRSYNSASVDSLNPAAYESLAGLGWDIHFGRVLKTKDTYICLNQDASKVVDDPVLELPDGSRQILTFTDNGSPLMLTAQRWRADCAGNSGLSIYSPDGVRYDMTHLVNVGTSLHPVNAWYATQITDRNGNYAKINYAATSSPEITSISTSDGRSLSFMYADSGTLNRRITRIVGPGQSIYDYGYQAVAGVAGKYFLTSVQRPDGTSWSYSYNGNLNSAAGSYLMRTATYPQGGVITYDYDFVSFDAQANPFNRSTVITGKSLSTGGNWTFAYAPGGPGAYDTTTVNTPSGTITYQHIGPNYSSSGNVWMVGLLMSKKTGTVQTETYSWDKQQISSEDNFRPGAFVTKTDSETYAPVLKQKKVIRDGATYTTSYSNFDSYGNSRTITESGTNGGNRTTNLTYYINSSSWIVHQVKDESFSGSSITRSFDSDGNLLSVTKNGVQTSYSYDGEGNVASTTFPRSLKHTYSQYMRGIPRSESQPESIFISRIVSDAGNVTSETNGDGKKTTYHYDGLNRIDAVNYPIGNDVSISYGINSKKVTRGALIENTSYDGFGRPLTVAAGGISRTYKYDALGRKTFESNPNSSGGTTYQYDMLDRLTRVTNGDGTFRTILYGASQTIVTDERGKKTTYTYRSYGDPEKQFLMSIAAPESAASTSLSRNTLDQVTVVTQGGLTRIYGYNGNNYLTSVNNPETGITTYGRDAAGNMTSRSVGASGTTVYAYDGQNRCTTITYPGSTPAVVKSYSKTHKLLTASSSVASHSYVYDDNNNLKSDSLTIDGVARTTAYTYDGNDQLASIIYPYSGREVSYAPDALGRPTQVSGYVSHVSYWPSGQIRQIDYANGTTTIYNQNSRLWPSSFSTQKGDAFYLNSSYAYDGAGNLKSISDTIDSSYNRVLDYDGIDRLTSISGPWGGGTIAYSGTGNITSQVLGSSSLYYTYGGTNQLSSISGSLATSFTYDVYGNMASGWGDTFTYDDAPSLRCVNCGKASQIEYAYDGLNRRIWITKAGVKTYEVYGTSDNLLSEYTPSQADKLVEYIYLGGKRIAQWQKDTVGMAASGTALTVTPIQIGVGQQVTLAVAVTGNNPTGSVTFKDGANLLGTTTLSAGHATFTTSFADVGSHALTASYGGDNLNTASDSAAVTLTVKAQSDTSTVLTATPNPAEASQQVTLTATVTGNNPTGTVTFNDGATALASVSLAAGKASFTTTFVSAGTHTLTASYGGDAQNTTSSSAATALTIGSGTAGTPAANMAAILNSILFILLD